MPKSNDASVFLSPQASALAKECSQLLEKAEPRCCSASTLSTLQTYEERLGGEFSTLNFQAVKVKACALGSRSAGAMRVWNAAWVQCQELRQRLEEMQKKRKCTDEIQSQQSAAANPQHTERTEKSGDQGDGESSPTQQLTPDKREVKHPETEQASTANPNHCSTPEPKASENEESRVQNVPQAPDKTEKITPTPTPPSGGCLPESKWRPREHRSDADLSRTDSVNKGDDDFPARQPLGRSLSEGSHGSFPLTSAFGFPPLNVRNKHCESRALPLELNLKPVSHGESLADGNHSCAPKSTRNEEATDGCVASSPAPTTPEALITAENNGCDIL